MPSKAQMTKQKKAAKKIAKNQRDVAIKEDTTIENSNTGPVSPPSQYRSTLMTSTIVGFIPPHLAHNVILTNRSTTPSFTISPRPSTACSTVIEQNTPDEPVADPLSSNDSGNQSTGFATFKGLSVSNPIPGRIGSAVDLNTAVPAHLPKYSLGSLNKDEQGQSSLATPRSTFGPARPPVTIAMSTVVQNLETKAIRLCVLGKPTNTLSTRLIVWAQSEALRMYRMQARRSSETAPVTFSRSPVAFEYPVEHWSLIRYPTSCSIATAPVLGHASRDEGDSMSTPYSIYTDRMFLFGANNEIRCVAAWAPFHHVDAIEDDGATDFDSIASPTKQDLRDTNLGLSDQPSSFDDNCELHGGIYNDEAYEFDEEELDYLRLPEAEDETDTLHGWSMRNFSIYISNTSSGLSVLATSETSVNGDWIDEEVNSTGTVIRRSIKKDVSSPAATEDATNVSQDTTLVQDPVTSRTNSNASGDSDWICELARVLLGTESMFTFLSVLEVQGNGNIAKDAVVSAFLRLVDLEREKRSDTLLPASCTLANVLGSLILPHTVFLGTTTLAAFLAQLEFGFTGEVTTVELYTAFDTLSKKEMRMRGLATTGVMGALGRALGKIK
ncbi:hypothetical protein BDW02DRAFT_617789 [Decorospora gaudefroyi]|uniref:Uncharacterized protein n=1 Tax=Decorospora gaudefroyi TaxID=184978 RepID=A0A6A5KFK7_9PLEO|nr:hypothetical protein BDW02DRAFT_617789 [Decorospora gaudefroyi]